ncbi:MAG: hypothetical protein ACLFNK_03040 [Candidatus Woesearchaeota archaeon]
MRGLKLFRYSSRKSQVSIFIIAGMVVLSLIGIAIYFATATQQVVDTQTFRKTPTSFRDYVEICMEDTTESALNNIGFQGGYLELPYYIRANDDAFISLGSRDEFGIPSWYFKGESRVPTIEGMEREISGYVEDNIHSCLYDFEGFSEYNVTEREPIDVDTVISDDKVSVEAYYPIDVSAEKASQTDYYEDFHADVRVKLGRMHELGKRIVHSEARNTNFEMELFNQMSAHPDIPITHQSFSARQERWSVDEIREEINLLIFYNLQRVRFKGTDYPDFDLPEDEYERFEGHDALDVKEGNIPEDVPADSYDYFNLFFDPNELPEDYDMDSEMSFEDIAAIVKYYPDDYLSVNIRPSSAGMISTNMLRLPNLGIPFPIQMGHFTYDVDFLVEINLVDEDAFQGDGYVFRFALPVSIKSNLPDKEADSFTLESEPVQFEDPCDDVTGEYTIEVLGRVGGYTNNPLRGAEISYDCLQFGCKLGETRAEAGTYRLTTGIPSSCSGGFINVEKEGYLPVREQHVQDQKDIQIDMKKLETYTVDVEKRRSNALSSAQPIGDDEVVVGTLDPADHDEVIAFEFVPGEPLPEIELIEDGAEYEVDLLLIDRDGSVTGGYKGDFEYDYMDATGRNKIVFSVAELSPTPLPVDKPENQMEIFEYIESDKYQEEAHPRFN